MAYTNVQFIGYVLDTAPQVHPDGSPQHRGLGDARLDIQARCQLMERAMQTARAALPQASPPVPEGDTLKVFMAPGLFFCGATGAYPMEEVQLAITSLQRMAADEQWVDWVFVFGSILGSSSAMLPTTPYDIDPLAPQSTYSFSLVQQGGVAPQGDASARALAKALASDVECMATAATPSSLLAGTVAQRPAASSGSWGREQQRVNYDGAGVFDLAGITWGLDVCQGPGGTAQCQPKPPQLPGQALVQLQLVPSCGTGMEAPGVITQMGGLVFHCDGSGPAGHSALARQVPPLADIPLSASAPVSNADIVLQGTSPVQDVAISALYAGGAGVVNVYPSTELPKQQVVAGNTIRMIWPASADYQFIFQLIYSSSGQFVTLVCEIRSRKANFYGNDYFLPLSLQTQDSSKQSVRIQMKLTPASSPYAGAVWCQINVPGFIFEGHAFEFSATYDGPPPYTVW
ncbi:hypothetical protein ASF11_24190 [Acidovorax sp. Leaf76]|uniref:hypothetical protein n=1 Tax=unclassified Acidovorax TaxID=2684926 RepID=UPI0006FAA4FE|nr:MULTISPECIES: hypothetical protein [unclassified Acidovorax]KQO21407.1 hypothetical protein ASF11_24190 [Acidovorax sp. Leaf76]KQO35440.1 hypothetical protein ASF19_23875 [Acidovorax sp. Leaf84]KQS37328.1 hypothetical protein ASG27_24510 [Acidovorax sp. Leaf191]